MLRTPEEQQAEPIGVRLKRLRLERGLSQRELSSPGVSYAYISRIEAGARTPSVKALRMLARKLGVSVEYLETGRDLGDVEERELKLADAELSLRLSDETSGAEETLRQVLGEAERAGDHDAASRASIGLGFAAARNGNHLDAVERLESALSEHPVAPHIRPDVYATLGQSYAALGAPERAVRVFEEVLDELNESAPEDTNAQIRFAALLSYTLTDAGQLERAGSVVREALDRVGGDADPANRIRLYWSLARAAMHDGRLVEALQYTRRAISLLEVTDDTVQLARGYLLAAGLEGRESLADEMREHLELAEKLLGTNPEPRDLGMFRIGQSWLAALDGDATTSVTRARDALDILGQYHGGEQGTAVWALARGLALEGNVSGARDAYERALDLLMVHRRKSDAAAAALEWGKFLQARGQKDEAAPFLQRAADLGLQLEVDAKQKR